MALSTYDMSAEQGSDFATTVTYTNDAGSAVNLTGYTSRMQVRQFAGSKAPFLTLTNTSGMAITAGTGVISVAITAAALSTVPAGSYVYDLEIVSGAGAVTKLLSGDFDVLAEVTR
jgi:hypothetical protein